MSDDAEALIGYAKVDWVVFGRWDRLHSAASIEPDLDYWGYTDVVTACGLRRDRAWVPGIITRMGAQRCSHCCDSTGLPRGIGSPKNDPACRALLGLDD